MNKIASNTPIFSKKDDLREVHVYTISKDHYVVDDHSAGCKSAYRIKGDKIIGQLKFPSELFSREKLFADERSIFVDLPPLGEAKYSAIKPVRITDFLNQIEDYTRELDRIDSPGFQITQEDIEIIKNNEMVSKCMKRAEAIGTTNGIQRQQRSDWTKNAMYVAARERFFGENADMAISNTHSDSALVAALTELNKHLKGQVHAR